MSNSQNNQFYKSNLDLDPMTFILQLDLDMVKMYHHTKSEVSMSRHSKVITCTYRHTDSMKTLPSHICGLSSIVTKSTHCVITIRQNILIFWVTLLLRKIQSAAIQKKKKKMLDFAQTEPTQFSTRQSPDCKCIIVHFFCARRIVNIVPHRRRGGG